MTDDVIRRRLQLLARGYPPIPLFGKTPAPKEWQKLTSVSREMIEMWGKVWPTASNTGCLTRTMPTFDLDIMHPPAAERVEEFVRDVFSDRGFVLVRIGKPPKRAIPFRASEPFKKISVPLISPMGGDGEKIELLCDGQQLCVSGEHPETRKPYHWHGAAPWDIPRMDLPYLPEEEARALVRNVVSILVDFGYARTAAVPARNGNGNGADNGGDRWTTLVGNIYAGRALHDSFRDLAAMLILAGINKGAANHLLHALAELIEHYDTRVEARTPRHPPRDQLRGREVWTVIHASPRSAKTALHRPDVAGHRVESQPELSGQGRAAARRTGSGLGRKEMRQILLGIRPSHACGDRAQLSWAQGAAGRRRLHRARRVERIRQPHRSVARPQLHRER